MNHVLHFIGSLLLSAELVFAGEYLLKMRYGPEKSFPVWPGLALCWVFTLVCSRHCTVLPLILCICLPAAVLLILTLLFRHTKAACRNLHYQCGDRGKENIYARKKVMLIVPHQDDDLNIASGILEQYVRHGSEIHVVFVTNGDYWNIAQVRLTEAIRALQSIGIPEDHVIFLGYADGWRTDAAHVYNSATVCRSRNGYTATYSLTSHPAWNEGNPYTAGNLIGDMQSVILAHRPDTILCTDFDSNVEHKATTLAFEKAMGRILKQEQDYHPVVLKAFAYCTAWTAEKDFPALNLLSTKDPGNQLPGIYRWSDRIRFPVDGTKLSRSLLESDLYRPFSLYRSQRAGLAAGAVINADKVFWHRRTDSLLYLTQIDVSSGNAEKLNDFMLLDSDDLADDTHQPFDGVWIPAPDDTKKTVCVTFAAPVDLADLILYDSPSPTDNILNARIVFDNGYCLETGALNGNGSGTSFTVNQRSVRSLRITLLETEGEGAGLSEIEAFGQPYTAPFSYVKLTDCEGHFAYDYIVDASGTDTFRLYAFGEAAVLSPEAYQVCCDHPNCSAEIVGDSLLVYCPAGESCSITVTCRGNKRLSDTIFLRNPDMKDRKKIAFAQHMEDFFHRRAASVWKQTVLFGISTAVRKCLRGILRRCKRSLRTVRNGN